MEFILEPLYKILAQVSVSGHLVYVCLSPSKHRVNLDSFLPLDLLSFVLLSLKMVGHQSSGSGTL